VSGPATTSVVNLSVKSPTLIPTIVNVAVSVSSEVIDTLYPTPLGPASLLSRGMLPAPTIAAEAL
jgi:hypothetical protein